MLETSECDLDGFPGSRFGDRELYAEVLLGILPIDSPRRVGQGKKLILNSVVIEALDDPTGSSGAGRNFQNYFHLKQGV